jgi:hypothetical protein
MADPQMSTPTNQNTDASTADLLRQLSETTTRLVRQEIELAKAEARQSAAKAGKGAGLLAGAGVSGHLVLIFVSVAAWWGLGESIGHGWSALVVAGIWLVIAAILGLMGRREMSAVSGLPRTAQTVKKIPAAARGNEGRS